MSWRFGKNGNGKTADSDGMQDNRRMIEMSKYVDTECVDDGVRDEDGGVNANRLTSRWDI